MFSWKRAKERATKKKISRSIIMSKLPVSNDGTISDYGLKYPADVRNAINKNYTDLKKRVTEDSKKFQDKAIVRRLKNA